MDDEKGRYHKIGDFRDVDMATTGKSHLGGTLDKMKRCYKMVDGKDRW